MIEIFVDGDACPVKDETYDVVIRYGVRVALVANARRGSPKGIAIRPGIGRGARFVANTSYAPAGDSAEIAAAQRRSVL